MKQLQIHRERIGRDWTLEYVGNQVGLKKSSVNDIEKGRVRPSFDVLMKLCRLFEVPHEEVEQLFAVAADEQ